MPPRLEPTFPAFRVCGILSALWIRATDVPKLSKSIQIPNLSAQTVAKAWKLPQPGFCETSLDCGSSVTHTKLPSQAW